MVRIFVNIFICFILIIISGFSEAEGQEKGKPFSRHYGPKDYKGGTQNWAVVEDNHGMIYIANQQGVIQYDGAEWHAIPNKNKSTIRSLALDDHGQIWVGAYGEMGFLAPEKNGALTFQSITSLVDKEHINFAEVWNIQPADSSIYLLTDNYLFRYRQHTLKAWTCKGEYFYTEMACRNHFLFQEIGGGLHAIINDSLVSVTGSDFFRQSRIHAFFDLGGDTVLIGTRSQGLFTAVVEIAGYKIHLRQLHSIEGEATEYFIKHSLYHGIKLLNGDMAFATIRGGVILIDKNFRIKEIYTSQTAIGHEACYYLIQAKDKSLWVALDNGLAHIELNSPFRYWDNESGYKGTITDINRHNKTLYISTASGVYYLDETAGTYISRFIQIPDFSQQTWCLLKVNDLRYKGDSALLASTSENIFLIENHRARSIYSNKSNYEIFRSPRNPRLLYAGTRNGLQVLEFKTGKYRLKSHINGINYEVRGLAEDKSGDLWASVSYKGVARISFTDSSFSRYSIEYFDTTDGLPDLKQVTPVFLANDLVFASDSGIMTFVPENRKFTFYQKLGSNLSRLQLNRFATGKNGHIYINGNIVLKPYGNGYIADSTPFRRIPATESDAVFADHDGKIWIGNPDGLYVYKPELYKPSEIVFEALIREASLSSGQKIFMGHGKPEKPEIDYKNNSLIFKYAAPFFDVENQTLYSYMLEGFDLGWSEFTGEKRKEYTNLSEGEYTFKVRAKNIYGQISTTATYHFIILPPWFRTNWAFAIYAILIILIFRLFIKLRTRQILREKDKLEKIIEERTAQINMQKEELLSQAEQLKAINAELEKLSIVVRETATAVTMFDNTGKFLWVNEGFTRMYGYTFDQFVTERSDNIFNCDLAPNIKRLIAGCIQNKKTIIYDFFTTTRSGEGLWAQTTLTPVLNDLGETISLIAIDSDITRLKDAEQEIFYQKDKIEKQTQLLEQKNIELEKLSIVARETDNAIIIMDSKGNFEWVNEGFTRMYGYTIDRLIAEKSHNIVGASANLNIKDLINVWFGNKKPIVYESMNSTRDGRLIWTQTTLTPILDRSGNLVKMVAIDTDITKLKEAQKQIEEQRNELEKANATKDKFFSIIAHDLRSPFASLLSLINILNDEFDNLDEALKKKYIGSVQEGAKRTFSLLENLLDWSRIQKGHIKFTPAHLEMAFLIQESISLHAEIITKKNIAVQTDIPDQVTVFADENMIRTILRNLISNAIKFSFPEGKIEISYQKNEKEIVFMVRDHGTGIQPDDLQKLFRIDIHHTTLGTAKERGTGLGLVLCREFAERNNGRIWVESEPGEGSTFYFSLPLSE